MSVSRRVIAHECRLLIRSRVCGALLVLLGGAGLYGLSAGHGQMQAQRATIEGLLAQESVRLARVATTLGQGTYALGIDGDSARLVADVPSPLASLAVGQRDVLPFYRSVSGRSLAYDGAGMSFDGMADEISNPERLVVGNLDLAFVLVVLCPLAVIALGHDVLSGEREGGTFGLWATSGASPARVVTLMLCVRGLVPILLATALILGGAVWVGAGRTEIGGVLLLVVVAWLYLSWWLAVTAVVIAGDRSSATNALVLFVIYLAVVVVGPSTAQLLFDAVAPATSQSAMAMRLRDRSDGLWGQIDAAAWQRFHAAYPDVPQDSPIVLEPAFEDSRAYGKKIVVWHYLMDVDALPELTAYLAVLERRDAMARRVHLLLPAVLATDLITAVARADVFAHLAFQRSVRQFQAANARRLRSLVFPGTVLTAANLPLYPEYVPPSSAPLLDRPGAARALGTLVALVLGCSGLAVLRLRRTFRPC
jgi:ABC-2 type transport system permease protein